jgi:hypothetical protein
LVNAVSLPTSLVIPGEVEESFVMEERGDKEIASKKQCAQMLKLVTKGVYFPQV